MRSGSLSRRYLAPLAVCAVLLGLAGCSTTPSSTAAVAAPIAGRGVGQPSTFLGANLDAVGCGSTGRCVAVGTSFEPDPATAAVSTSNDGGLSWQAAGGGVASGATMLGASCAARVCMVIGRSLVGALIYASPRPGAGFAPSIRTSASSLAEGVACAGLRWCLAVSADSTHLWAATSLDAGSTWTSGGTLPATTATVLRLSCSSTADCLASAVTTTGAAELLVTHDGGLSWTPASLPSQPAALSVLGGACEDATQCYAIVSTSQAGASALLQSDDGGSSFTVPSGAPAQVAVPLAVACASTTCVVVGKAASGAAEAAQLPTLGSGRMLSLSYAPTPLLSVSCSSPTRCVAASSASLVVLSTSVPKPSQDKGRQPQG
jgi:hypothetical protein